MAGESIKWNDCKTLPVLTQTMDRVFQQKRVQDFQETNSLINRGFFFDDAQQIKSLLPQSIISQTPLTVGSLVYLVRERNIAKADAVVGIPAMGVVIANVQGEQYLWSLSETYIYLNVDGVPITGPTMLTVYMGVSGRGSFVPPDNEGGVNQKIAVALYYNSEISRWYCRVNPTSVFVSL